MSLTYIARIDAFGGCSTLKLVSHGNEEYIRALEAELDL
jgi:hypothetical protein